MTQAQIDEQKWKYRQRCTKEQNMKSELEAARAAIEKSIGSSLTDYDKALKRIRSPLHTAIGDKANQLCDILESKSRYGEWYRFEYLLSAHQCLGDAISACEKREKAAFNELNKLKNMRPDDSPFA